MTRRNRSLADLLGTDEKPKADGRRNNRGIVAPHRVRLATAQAELAEIRAAKLRGLLIPAADVEAEWQNIITDARQRLLAVPSRLGVKLGLSRDQVTAVDGEIRAALAALSASGEADHDGRS
ncbi:MAG: hypothetical protein AB7O04_01650 [Hyphomonadaceae bacterium]